jgi:DNA-binding beta-propeller fold protein YncE
MKYRLAILTLPLFASFGIPAGSALADDDSAIALDRVVIDRHVDTFAVLPDGVRHPEGIAANPANGDIYTATFDAPPGNHPNKLLRFDRRGRLIASRDFGNTPLLGLEFDRANNKVYILNVGNFAGVDSKVQRVAADLSQLEDVAIIPPIGAPVPRQRVNPDDNSPASPSIDTIMFEDNAHVPNAMVFDSHGNLYVSDSFQGAVFRIDNVANCHTPCFMATVTHDPLLATAGFPPFGANGLAFNRDESVLFIANTGDDRVLAFDKGLGTVSVFAESLNGADGLVFDKRSGLLWVCNNQADEVVALNEKGRPVVTLGEFRGINRNGTPNGLLFPASPVIVGDEIFVTNLAIALTKAVGDEPEEDVTRWTLSRMRLPHRED